MVKTPQTLLHKGMSLSISSSISSWVIVELDELGLSSRSFSIWSLLRRPKVDGSSDNVTQASSTVNGMYVLSLLSLLILLMLLMWLSSVCPVLIVTLYTVPDLCLASGGGTQGPGLTISGFHLLFLVLNWMGWCSVVPWTFMVCFLAVSILAYAFEQCQHSYFVLFWEWNASLWRRRLLMLTNFLWHVPQLKALSILIE